MRFLPRFPVEPPGGGIRCCTSCSVSGDHVDIQRQGKSHVYTVFLHFSHNYLCTASDTVLGYELLMRPEIKGNFGRVFFWCGGTQFVKRVTVMQGSKRQFYILETGNTFEVYTSKP